MLDLGLLERIPRQGKYSSEGKLSGYQGGLSGIPLPKKNGADIVYPGNHLWCPMSWKSSVLFVGLHIDRLGGWRLLDGIVLTLVNIKAKTMAVEDCQFSLSP